ncbi:MAG: PilN domain-containing protein [Elusimicrobiota bacterium]
MSNINLLPKEILEREKNREIDTLIMLGVILVFMIAFFIYGIRFMSYQGTQFKINKVNDEIGKLSSIVVEMDALESTQNELSSRLNVINNLSLEKYAYPKFLYDFVRCVPKNVWVTSLVTNLANNIMNIECNAVSLDLYGVSRFMSNLFSYEKFEDVELIYIHNEAVDGAEASIFNVTFKYRVA